MPRGKRNLSILGIDAPRAMSMGARNLFSGSSRGVPLQMRLRLEGLQLRLVYLPNYAAVVYSAFQVQLPHTVASCREDGFSASVHLQHMGYREVPRQYSFGLGVLQEVRHLRVGVRRATRVPLGDGFE